MSPATAEVLSRVEDVRAEQIAQSEARAAMELLGGYRPELAFYHHVAGCAPTSTPHVYTAQMSYDSSDFVLLPEGLKQWDNADHLAGLSVDRAIVCIDALAALHAWSSDRANAAVLQAFPSIETHIARDLLVPALEPGWQVYLDNSSHAVPHAVARFAEKFTDHAGEALSALTQSSMLLHGDIRADNLFFDGDRLKVVDFQFASRGAGAADIAYLVVLPVMTLNGWDALPERSRALCVTLTHRAVAAIDEIDALEVFT